MDDLDTLEQIAYFFNHGWTEQEIQDELDLDPVDLLVLIRKYMSGELPAERDM